VRIEVTAGGTIQEETMTRRTGICGIAAAFAASLAFGMAGSVRPAAAQQSNHSALGGYLFKTYCATCHGTSGRGDGPLADAMRRKPANLTEIAKRNKGTFPREMVFKVIDGRTKVPGHGGPDMPVWGDAFLRTAETADEDSVKHRIQALVDYLETVQARDAQ
jgi:mono/diheme cytochrome c family protein